MPKKRTILFNLSGAKCATTWLSECFKSGRGAYSDYSTTYFSKFFPLPDIRHAREGFVNKKIIYNARLKASLENLRVEDQIFMNRAKSHEFKNIGNTDEVRLINPVNQGLRRRRNIPGRSKYSFGWDPISTP